MDGKMLHSEMMKLHEMVGQLYDCFNPTKRASNIYLIIDEQYYKIMRELKAKGVFEDEKEEN